jgi:hypothetical protein
MNSDNKARYENQRMTVLCDAWDLMSPGNLELAEYCSSMDLHGFLIFSAFGKCQKLSLHQSFLSRTSHNLFEDGPSYGLIIILKYLPKLIPVLIWEDNRKHTSCIKYLIVHMLSHTQTYFFILKPSKHPGWWGGSSGKSSNPSTTKKKKKNSVNVRGTVCLLQKEK